MRSDWKEVTIESLKADTPNAIAMGPFGSRIKADNFVEFGVPVIKGGNLNGSFLNESEYSFLTEKKADELKSSNAFPLDIVITHRGTIGQVGIIPKDAKFKRYVVSQSQLKVSLDDNKVNPYYVYYFLNAPIGQHRLLMNASQVGVPAIAKASTSVKEILIPLPDKDYQDKVVNILLSLENKINNNNRINQNLEQIAQALFKSWFVDFDPVKAKMEAIAQGNDPQLAAMEAISGKTAVETQGFASPEYDELRATADLFPEQLVESELGLIPEGWILKPLYETAEYVNGGAFKSKDFSESKEGLPIIKIAELKSGISAQTKYTSKEMPEKYRINNDDMLYSWSGSPETSLEVFKWYGGQGWLNQHIFKINTENIEQKVFVYYLLKFLKPQLIQIAKNKQTTGLGHVTVADMKRMQVVIPNDISFQLITDNFISLFEQASNCKKQNFILSQQRDTLLPRLLSGKIDVLFN
jgi:type I restriction enzyme S subunit